MLADGIDPEQGVEDLRGGVRVQSRDDLGDDVEVPIEELAEPEVVFYRPQAGKGGKGGWQQFAAIPFVCVGTTPSATVEYKLAGQVLAVLLLDLCPFKIISWQTTGGTTQVSMSVVNNTPREIVGLTLAVPTSDPAATQKGDYERKIAPGEKKTITVAVPAHGNAEMRVKQAYLCGLVFGYERPPLPPTPTP